MVAVRLVVASTIHSPVALVRVPVRTMVPWCIMIKVVASKCAVHPSLHSVPTETSAAPGKFGNRCALLAGSGTPGGRRRSHVCVHVGRRLV